MHPNNTLDIGCYATMGDVGPHGGSAATTSDRRKHFVIGSTREPCEWFVSLFAHRSAQTHLAEAKRHRFRTLLDEMRPNQSDVTARFRAMLATTGSMLENFERQHTLHPNIDCWVQPSGGDFENSLRRCLRLFERQGGRVDWSDSALRSFLQPGQSARPPCKNCPVGNQLRSHEKCSSHFVNRELALLVEQMEAPLYAAFGWAGCCDAKMRPDFVAKPLGVEL